MASLLVILFLNLTRRYDLNKEEQVVLLNFKNTGCIIHQHGGDADVYICGNDHVDYSNTLESIKKCLMKLGVKKSRNCVLPDQALMIEQKKSGKAILMNASMLDVQVNKEVFNRNRIWILDGTTKLWKIREWRKQAQNLHLRFLHTAETGPIYLDCQGFHEFSRKN